MTFFKIIFSMNVQLYSPHSLQGTVRLLKFDLVYSHTGPLRNNLVNTTLGQGHCFHPQVIPVPDLEWLNVQSL